MPRRTSTAITACALALAAAGMASGQTVPVREGDTLSAVAERHGVSVAALARANGIVDRNLVRAGRRLRLPSAAPAVCPKQATVALHVVRPGETLSWIAVRYGCDAKGLAALNGVRNVDVLVAGQRIRLARTGRSTSGRVPRTVGSNLAELPAAVRIRTPRATARRGAVQGVGTYVVRTGDSLSAIAQRLGTTVARLRALNGIADTDILAVGRVLRVAGGATAASRRPETRPAAETKPSAQPTGAQPQTAATQGEYVVRVGDTLAGIAAAKGVSVAALVAANRIVDSGFIVAGQRLVIPLAGTAAPIARPDIATVSHSVGAGETLSTIALRYRTSVGAIMRINEFSDPNAIVVGRVIKVPAPSAISSPDAVRALIDREAAGRGVDPKLARAVAWQESGFAQAMISHAGAIGVMQVLPETSDWAGRYIVGRALDPYRVEDNIAAGVAFLDWLLEHAPDLRTAIAGYYQGAASVKERGMLPETKQYVDNVMALIGRV